MKAAKLERAAKRKLEAFVPAGRGGLLLIGTKPWVRPTKAPYRRHPKHRAKEE